MRIENGPEKPQQKKPPVQKARVIMTVTIDLPVHDLLDFDNNNIEIKSTEHLIELIAASALRQGYEGNVIQYLDDCEFDSKLKEYDVELYPLGS